MISTPFMREIGKEEAVGKEEAHAVAKKWFVPEGVMSLLFAIEDMVEVTLSIDK